MATIPSSSTAVKWILRRGVDYAETWVWTTDGTTLKDMSLGTLSAVFAPTIDGTPALTATTANGKISGDASGNIAWALDATDVAALPASGVFNLRYTSAGLVPEDPIHGTFTIQEDVPV